MDLKGRTALITGAGQGIGRACAEVFASLGADLVLLDKNSATLPEVCKTIGKTGRKIVPVHVDLTDTNALRRELETQCSNLTMDILVNNAGFDRPGTTSKMDKAGFEAVLGIHLTVPLLLIQFVLGWERWVGEDGLMISLDRFGASAPYETLMKEFGFTGENVAQRVLERLR